MMKKDNENTNVTNCTVTSESTMQSNDRLSYRQRKMLLEEYRKTFLCDTRIIDRKPVFVSGKLRDRLDRIVRLFGGRRTSVSGLLENIALKHVDEYDDDIEAWRKM